MKNKSYLIIALITLLLITFAAIYYIYAKNESPYNCPEENVIDCMPSPSPSSSYCEPDYMEWIENNCRNVRIDW